MLSVITGQQVGPGSDNPPACLTDCLTGDDDFQVKASISIPALPVCPVLSALPACLPPSAPRTELAGDGGGLLVVARWVNAPVGLTGGFLFSCLGNISPTC